MYLSSRSWENCFIERERKKIIENVIRESIEDSQLQRVWQDLVWDSTTWSLL